MMYVLLGFIMLLTPFLFVYMMIQAIKFNKYFLMFLPLVLIIVFLIFQWNQIVQLWHVFMNRCVIWFIGALILSLLISYKWRGFPRTLFCAVTCIVACIIPVVMSNQTIAPIGIEEFSRVQEATVYRHQGDGLKLNQKQIKEFQNMMESLSVKEDIMEQSRLMAFDDHSSWFCLEAVLPQNQKMRIAFFQKNDEPDLMRVEVDDQIYCYRGIDEKDLGGDWINEQISSGLRQSILDQYQSSLKALKESFVIEGTKCRFTIPKGLPDDLKVVIIGLPDSKNSVDYFLDDVQNWNVGQTYTFDVARYDSYRYLYLSAQIKGESFDLVNIFDLLPNQMKSDNAQERFHDMGI